MSKVELINYTQQKQFEIATFVFRNRHHMDDQTRAMLVQECAFWETLEQVLPAMDYGKVAIVRNYLGIPPSHKDSNQATTVQLSLF